MIAADSVEAQRPRRGGTQPFVPPPVQGFEQIMRTGLFIAGCWVALFGLYLLFAGQTSMSELLAALCTASIAIAGHLNTRRVAHRELRIVAPWGRLAAGVAVALIHDTILIAWNLIVVLAGRRPRGAMTIQPFDSGGFTRKAAARRGITILAASIAPNGYVIEIREPPQGMLMHRLVPQPPAPDQRWPV